MIPIPSPSFVLVRPSFVPITEVERYNAVIMTLSDLTKTEVSYEKSALLNTIEFIYHVDCICMYVYGLDGQGYSF